MSVSDMKHQYLSDNTGLSGSIEDLEWAYYTPKSGLTPIWFYSIADHKRVYFESVTGLSGQTLRYLERAYWGSQGIPSGSYSDMANYYYDFSPYRLPSLELALDANNTGSVLADGSPVSQWNDLSGKGRHVAQAVGTKQPLFKIAGPNGQSTVQFDGINSSIENAYSINEPFTQYAIIKQDIVSAIQSRVSGGLLHSTDGHYSIYNGIMLTGGVAPTTPVVLSAVSNVGTSSISINGTTVVGDSGGNPGTVVGAIGCYPGGTELTQGSIAAVLVFSVAHDDATRKRIEKWLGAKYGITVA